MLRGCFKLFKSDMHFQMILIWICSNIFTFLIIAYLYILLNVMQISIRYDLCSLSTHGSVFMVQPGIFPYIIIYLYHKIHYQNQQYHNWIAKLCLEKHILFCFSVVVFSAQSCNSFLKAKLRIEQVNCKRNNPTNWYGFNPLTAIGP